MGADAPLPAPGADGLARLDLMRTVAEAAAHDHGFGVAQWAVGLAVSERTLYRQLRQLTGQPPATYLRQMRLTRALAILEQRTAPSVAAVAFAVGFDDPAYFAKAFYKHYGRRASSYLHGPAQTP